MFFSALMKVMNSQGETSGHELESIFGGSGISLHDEVSKNCEDSKVSAMPVAKSGCSVREINR